METRNPDTYSVNGYVAMSLLLEGAKKAGSLDPVKVANTLQRQHLQDRHRRRALPAQRRPDRRQIWIYQVDKSEFQQVEWEK